MWNQTTHSDRSSLSCKSLWLKLRKSPINLNDLRKLCNFLTSQQKKADIQTVYNCHLEMLLNYEYLLCQFQGYWMNLINQMNRNKKKKWKPVWNLFFTNKEVTFGLGEPKRSKTMHECLRVSEQVRERDRESNVANWFEPDKCYCIDLSVRKPAILGINDL